MKLSFQRGSSTHRDKVYRVKQVPNWHTSCYPFPMLFDKRRTLERKGENCTLESAQHERESGSVDLEQGLCKELKLWNVCNCWPNQTNWPWWAIHNRSALEPFIIVLFLEVWKCTHCTYSDKKGPIKDVVSVQIQYMYFSFFTWICLIYFAVVKDKTMQKVVSLEVTKLKTIMRTR